MSIAWCESKQIESQCAELCKLSIWKWADAIKLYQKMWAQTLKHNKFYHTISRKRQRELLAFFIELNIQQ